MARGKKGKLNDDSSEPKSNIASESISYTVEKVIKRRVYKGENQYYVKWEGYSEKYNTWEPAKNFHSPNLIDEFESAEAKRQQTVVQKSSFKRLPAQVLRVLGTDARELKYEISFVGTDKTEIISSEVAHEKYTQLIIDYFEGHVLSGVQKVEVELLKV